MRKLCENINTELEIGNVFKIFGSFGGNEIVCENFPQISAKGQLYRDFHVHETEEPYRIVQDCIQKMQEPSASDLAASSSAASEMNNSSSCDRSLEDNLAILAEMFPESDVTMLKNYLEIFHENPDCMQIVIGMLLEGAASGLNSGENSLQQSNDLDSPQQSHGFESPHEPLGLNSPQQPSSSNSMQQPSLHQPSGSNSPQQPSGSDSMQQPSGSNSMQQPSLHQPSGSNSMQQPSLHQPSGSDSPQQPSGSDSMHQPSGSNSMQQPSLHQPSGSDSPQQPSGSNSMQQPSLHQPSGSDSLQQPSGSDSPQQPSGSDSPQQPSGSDSLQQLSDSDSLQQPQGLKRKTDAATSQESLGSEDQDETTVASLSQPKRPAPYQLPSLNSPQQPSGSHPSQKPSGSHSLQEPSGSHSSQEPSGSNSPHQPHGLDSPQQLGSSDSSSNSPQQPQGLKRKTDAATSEERLCNEDEGTVTPSQPKRAAVCKTETGCSSLPAALGKVEDHDSNSNNGETSSSLASSAHKDDNDIIFVKSLASPPKPSFRRTTPQSNPETTSPRQHSGIRIRFKGGALHPSMNKPKRLQIVNIHVGGTSGMNIRQAPSSGNQPTPSQSTSLRQNLRTRLANVAAATATTVANNNNHSSPRPCSSTDLSKSSSGTTWNSLTPRRHSLKNQKTCSANAATATATTNNDNHSSSTPCSSSDISASSSGATCNSALQSPGTREGRRNLNNPNGKSANTTTATATVANNNNRSLGTTQNSSPASPRFGRQSLNNLQRLLAQVAAAHATAVANNHSSPMPCSSSNLSGSSSGTTWNSSTSSSGNRWQSLNNSTVTNDNHNSSPTPCSSSDLSESSSKTTVNSSTLSPESIKRRWKNSKTATATTVTNNNHQSSIKPCTSSDPSGSSSGTTGNSSTTPSQSTADLSQSTDVTTNGESTSAAAALSDLEILKKVFPDADPTYITSLLDKHADKPNRVALVGKELGSNTNTPAQNTKKKVAPPVTWFWESENGKLVPFTDSECRTLEREFNTRDNSHAEDAFVKVVKLPGSSKHFTVDFSAMSMLCERVQTMIFRVPGGSDERKEIGGKSLIPQEALSVPNDWQQQSGNAELISVRPGSAEWDHVQRSLVRSMRNAQVVDIQRVQNQWLYRKYAIQRHLLKDKNGPTCINEKELFHGTRHTKPDAIWTGEDGFDMRYSADGMWGRGTYFASEAAYCHHGFVYNCDRRAKKFQLFLAHVLTGDSVCLPPNRSIKMPPCKKGSNIRFDSVNGVTNGCTVYILYKLDMAYPAYLITYTLKH